MRLTSADFTLKAYWDSITLPYLPEGITPAAREKLLDEAWASPEWRRKVTRCDPLAFATLYLSQHLRSDATGGQVTFSDAHLDWCERAKSLMTPPAEAGVTRDATVAPRELGKSTWHFLIIPMWAAAHGWTKFIAAFADSAGQAETHLASFKTELEQNALLRLDYPELCAPLQRERGMLAADKVTLYRARSGFVFAARGMDTRTLGLKIGAHRPDLIILDDIEPGEATYSDNLMTKRLRTLQDTILPLNDKARFVLVGTVTMMDSIIHQLAKHARGQGTADWIIEDGWRAHYYPPIVQMEDGTERSIWPARWSMERLQAIRGTRAYLKNYENDPMGADGDYWKLEDFIHGDLEGQTRSIISVDPAVTTKDSSDFTGVAVVGWKPGTRGGRGSGKCMVKVATQVKLSFPSLRNLVMKLCADDPSIRAIVVESNQGGEVWSQIFHSMPAPLVFVHQSVKKEVRAADVLNLYQAGRVIHGPGLYSLESQMVAFPNAIHDDMVDAVGTGVAYFLTPNPKAVKYRAALVQTT